MENRPVSYEQTEQQEQQERLVAVENLSRNIVEVLNSDMSPTEYLADIIVSKDEGVSETERKVALEILGEAAKEGVIENLKPRYTDRILHVRDRIKEINYVAEGTSQIASRKARDSEQHHQNIENQLRRGDISRMSESQYSISRNTSDMVNAENELNAKIKNRLQSVDGAMSSAMGEVRKSDDRIQEIDDQKTDFSETSDIDDLKLESLKKDIGKTFDYKIKKAIERGSAKGLGPDESVAEVFDKMSDEEKPDKAKETLDFIIKNHHILERELIDGLGSLAKHGNSAERNYAQLHESTVRFKRLIESRPDQHSLQRIVGEQRGMIGELPRMIRNASNRQNETLDYMLKISNNTANDVMNQTY